MKSTFILFLLVSLYRIGFAQQTPTDGTTVTTAKAAISDDALLLDYYQNQRFADAEDYLKKIYAEPVTDIKALKQLAYTSQMAGKLVDAEGYYLRIYNTDSTNTTVLFNLGSINLRRGNNLKAEAYYKKIIQKDTTNFMVYKQLANISIDKSDPVNELVYLQKANKLNPAEPDVASDLSDLYVALKQFPLAEKILDQAITQDPENSVLLLSQLKLVYSQNKWEETEATCLKLTQLGSQSGFVLTKLGIAYYNLKDYECAIETMAGISDIAQTETTYYIAALAYKALKDQNHAVTYLAKAIDAGISSNISGYYSEMGDSYELLRKYKNASFAYQKGLQFDEKPITYYMLATLYDSELKNKKMARFYYSKYLATDPPAKEAKYKAYAKSRVILLGH